MKWVTRERARVDRIACPWLIARFVDPEPQFLFVPATKVPRRRRARERDPVDIPTSSSDIMAPHCSFDAFIERLRARRSALQKLAPIVRGADTEDRDRRRIRRLYAAAPAFRRPATTTSTTWPASSRCTTRSTGSAGTPAAAAGRASVVSLHGAAKSVVAAAHFRRLAARRGSPSTRRPPAPTGPRAGARRGEGLAERGSRPRRAAHVPPTLYDLSATRVVSFGCEVTPAKGQRGGSAGTCPP